MQKRIGIVGWSVGTNSFGVTNAYLNYFSKYGQVEILTPRKENDIPNVDLIVMPGGADTSSHLYGELPSFHNGNPDLFKEWFMIKNLPKVIEAGIPVFGICLGMQQINVYFGGKLNQHQITSYSNKGRDERVEKLINIRFDILTDMYDRLEEKVKNMTFSDWNEKTLNKYEVNSLHHQCVTPRTQSEQLIALAMTGDPKNAEILIHETLPIAGVQYHPEELSYCPFSDLIIKHLLFNF